MIGSKRKRDAIYESLLKDGYQPFDVERVHSPSGLTSALKRRRDCREHCIGTDCEQSIPQKKSFRQHVIAAMDILLT
jgi:hypothetical protein